MATLLRRIGIHYRKTPRHLHIPPYSCEPDNRISAVPARGALADTKLEAMASMK